MAEREASTEQASQAALAGVEAVREAMIDVSRIAKQLNAEERARANATVLGRIMNADGCIDILFLGHLPKRSRG